MELDWEEAKRDILESINVDHTVMPSNLRNISGAGVDQFGSTGSRKRRHDFSQNSPTRAFADVVRAWNRARLRNESYPLLSRLSNVTARHARDMDEYVHMLRSILFEDDERDSYPASNQKQLVAGAIRHSEQEYMVHIKPQGKVNERDLDSFALKQKRSEQNGVWARLYYRYISRKIFPKPFKIP